MVNLVFMFCKLDKKLFLSLNHALCYRSPGQPIDGTTSRVLAPKHIPVPNVPQDGNIMFEVIMFVFTGTTSFLQFLHLYRTVWWLPQSYTRYTMVCQVLTFSNCV